MLHIHLIPQTVLFSEAKRGKFGNVMSGSLGDWHVTSRENMVALRKGSKWPRRNHIPQAVLSVKTWWYGYMKYPLGFSGFSTQITVDH